MVKLIKLILSFLLSVLCALPIPALSASKSTRPMWPVSTATDKKTLAMLLPAKSRQSHEKLISTFVKNADKNTRSVSSIPGIKHFLKASELELFAGVSLMNLGYTEFGVDGAWYDDETGILPGLLLGGTVYWPNWYASLKLNTYFGNVEYRGQTQSFKSLSLSGLPINSRSDANIFDTTAIAGYQFSGISLYGGFGYYFWRRNIRPTTINNGLQVSGMLEFYSWRYALLGINVPVPGVGTAHIHLDIRAMRMLQANIEVNFLGYGGYDNANLNLGEDWGLRIALPWTFHLSRKRSTITIEPWYTRWNLNQSNAIGLTTNGVYTGSMVHEPQSETRNVGISVYFRFLM